MMSRHQVAGYLARTSVPKRKTAIRQVAAWLLQSKRGHEVSYLARDVAAIREVNGQAWAKVTSARPLTKESQESVEAYLMKATGANKVVLELRVDAALLGGLRVETATSELDTTLRTKLTRLAGLSGEVS